MQKWAHVHRSDMDERLQVLLLGLSHLILRNMLPFWISSLSTAQIQTISHSRGRRFILHYHMNKTRKVKKKKEKTKKRKRKCKKPS